jgi:hypothetical protein
LKKLSLNADSSCVTKNAANPRRTNNRLCEAVLTADLLYEHPSALALPD